MTTNDTIQTRLAKYGLAAGAISSAAAADVVLVDDAPIAIPSGPSTINFSNGCLNFDLNFAYSTFQTGFNNSWGSVCCGYSTYTTTYGGSAYSYCTNYAQSSTNSQNFSAWLSAGCESNVQIVDTAELGDDVEANIARCPDAESADRMIEAIDKVRVKGDSCGGVVTCVVRGCPRGLGAPVFDKLEADLAKAMLSLPATKGFEIGSGFEGVNTTGSEHNDEFYMDPKTGIRTRTNRSGGIQGGISNGEIVELKIAFKPTSTITQPQNTVNRDGVDVELKAKGRHDPCVVPRAVPMVESMVALVLVDHLMMQYAQCNLLGREDYSNLVMGNMKTLYDPAFIGGDGKSGGEMSTKDMSAAFSED